MYTRNSDSSYTFFKAFQLGSQTAQGQFNQAYTPYVVETVAQMQALNPITYPYVRTLGYFDKSDNGGGFFFAVSSTSSVDGGAVIQSSLAPIKYFRDFQGDDALVDMWGAVPNRTGIDAALQNAWTYAKNNGKTTVFGGGVYKISTAHTWDTGKVRIDYGAVFSNSGGSGSFNFMCDTEIPHKGMIVDWNNYITIKVQAPLGFKFRPEWWNNGTDAIVAFEELAKSNYFGGNIQLSTVYTFASSPSVPIDLTKFTLTQEVQGARIFATASGTQVICYGCEGWGSVVERGPSNTDAVLKVLGPVKLSNILLAQTQSAVTVDLLSDTFSQAWGRLIYDASLSIPAGTYNSFNCTELEIVGGTAVTLSGGDVTFSKPTAVVGNPIFTTNGYTLNGIVGGVQFAWFANGAEAINFAARGSYALSGGGNTYALGADVSTSVTNRFTISNATLDLGGTGRTISTPNTSLVFKNVNFKSSASSTMTLLAQDISMDTCWVLDNKVGFSMTPLAGTPSLIQDCMFNAVDLYNCAGILWQGCFHLGDLTLRGGSNSTTVFNTTIRDNTFAAGKNIIQHSSLSTSGHICCVKDNSSVSGDANPINSTEVMFLYNRIFVAGHTRLYLNGVLPTPFLPAYSNGRYADMIPFNIKCASSYYTTDVLLACNSDATGAQLLDVDNRTTDILSIYIKMHITWSHRRISPNDII